MGKHKDYLGLVYAKLTLLESRASKEKILARCECGVERVLRLPDIVAGKTRSCGCSSKSLRAETNIKKFGVPNTFTSPVCKEKMKVTLLDRLGVDNAAKSKDVRSKIKATNNKRYGGDSPAHSKEVKDKIKATNNAKYGRDYGLQNSSVREKILISQAKNDYCSTGETELRNWITDTFGLDFRKSQCGGTSPFQVDIYIPSKNLAIEYNGDYWHSEANGKGNDYHKHKTDTVANQKGAQLIHIFDSEWYGNRDAVKSFLSAKLAKLECIRASKCEVREIRKGDADHLFIKHLQGVPKNAVKFIGMFYKGELVSAMSFSSAHRQNMSRELNLSRYIVKDGIRIHGGLSKMSKYAEDLVGEFVTFVHKRLSNGNSYVKAGYVVVDELAPDYWYYDTRNSRAVSKQSRKKSVVGTVEGMTEHEHAKIDGLYRVWDCGKIKLKFCRK